ncbi:ral GTPase-activating protein subunit alpha-2-like isoform X4 [Dreissena polymorpha]|uniref:ral GTPase-activating protein subunit alpha-2-like isoform X4 n=1 Tax=Dreissena polymorpha TaxID=45954 RepID=UPI0022643337|nr:ral GTPase-activating protein subunit alpha-2-like isoform X4 [Dreissena polymorpha]
MSSALARLRKSNKDGDIKKAAQKVSDPKKDTITRLRHLRTVLENYETAEAKKFFEDSYSHIYYIFFDNFVTIETDLKQRANKTHREELDHILLIFEKIIVFLPEVIQRRWMFHSIGRIMKKLLHPGNGLRLRRDGMRLFLMWYQILQEHAGEECHEIFLQLIPGLGDGEHQNTLYGRTASTPDIRESNSSITIRVSQQECILRILKGFGYGGIIAAGEITPILPVPGEKQPENITKFFFEAFLQFMVSEVSKIEWKNKSMREASFLFLFNKFKQSYLMWLMPNFDKNRTIYNPDLGLPGLRTSEHTQNTDEPDNVSECRDIFIRWLTTFTISSRKPDPDAKLGVHLSSSALADEGEGEGKGTSEGADAREGDGEPAPGSNTSTLSGLSNSSHPLMERDSPNNSFSQDVVHSPSEYEIVRHVMYSTRANVDILHEIFRQALLFSFKHGMAIRRVIAVYKDWFQCEPESLPVFMLDPSETPGPYPLGLPSDLSQSLSDILEEEGSIDSVESAPIYNPLQASRDSGDLKSWLRNASYLGAVQDLADGGDYSQYDVRAGQQKLIQLCFTNMANVFLLRSESEAHLNEQVDICKRVLNIYRQLVVKIPMEQKTWEQILRVLLCITTGVQGEQAGVSRNRGLGMRLAQPIFQTLIVTWIKSNLQQYISVELWDQFLQVMSSLTSWPELIHEWAKTMMTLTTVFAKHVYSLDLGNLPLERLTEQKEKKRRQGKQCSENNKSKVETSFSKVWSKSGETEQLASGQASTFERSQTKYKSDGAGGSRSRPDIPGKQRSLSGTPSPCHSRSASASSDLANLVRSNSEGNITDPAQLAERIKGIMSRSTVSPSCKSNSARSLATALLATMGPDINKTSDAAENADDQELASLTSVPSVTSPVETPSSESASSALQDAMDHSGSVSSERSDTDTVRRSRSPSPTSAQYRIGTRTPSPTPSSELGVDLPCTHKDSPTPDRDSLHIEIVTSSVDHNRGSLEKSVLSGGTCQGWLPDVAVVMWRRMLGALGDVNKIEDPAIHASVFEHLCELHETLCRMRDNLGVTVDNQSTPTPPELIPPQTIFSSWLFECLTLSNKYKKGKLLAYQLLCQMMIRAPDMSLSQDLLAHFYYILHTGLNSQDQDVRNVLIKYSGPKLFYTPLPGHTMLLIDVVTATESVINSLDVKESPRLEAVSILGSLVCFANHYKDIPALHADMERSTVKADLVMERVVNLLLKAGKREPAGLARCIAINSLGIFLYEEISHGTRNHVKFAEAVNVLLATLGCKDRQVAKTATDMLALLADHVDKFLEFHPGLPKKIVQVLSSTVCVLVPANGQIQSEEERRLMVAMVMCVGDWCLKIPMHCLLETSEFDKGCLNTVFQMLNVVVSGHSNTTLETASRCVGDLWNDPEYQNLRKASQPGGVGMTPSNSSGSIVVIDRGKKGTASPSSAENSQTTNSSDPVVLVGRLMMNLLVNHLSHFPMGVGASRLVGSVSEYHDMPDLNVDNLKVDLFAAPNIQFFVLNQRTLISFVELPALLDLPGGGVTAGLTTAHTVCRVVLRDLTGKYCWESSVLYGPPWCPKGSYFENARTLHGLTVGMDTEPLVAPDDSEVTITTTPRPRALSDLPMFESTEAYHDNLFDLLGYVGHTSPECQLYPGIPLNIESPIPEDLNEHAETLMKDMLLQQKNAETQYFNKHKNDAKRMEDDHMLARPQMPSENQEPISPFQMCRMLIDQMGFLSWEKRCHFDLLKQSDKLRREIKHMDAQRCRETHKFAVIYVAEGQEDKNSVLSNAGGSSKFEHFVAGLGWEVDLEVHKGFLGGLQQNKTTGDTAPYYATPTCEIVYHVSTRIPEGSEESRHIKMRHLGNDEVHIVWSEHTRDYRRGIIPTDFGDVLIIIYPLPSGLFRIHIDRKPEVPLFGPLFNGAIVDHRVLPGLVRATAVNASRVIRSQKPFYHSFFEERAQCLDSIMKNHVDKTIFENFAADVFAPVLPPNSTIVESPSDSSLAMAPSLSQSEISQSNATTTKSNSTLDSQVSPTPSRQSRVSIHSSPPGGFFWTPGLRRLQSLTGIEMSHGTHDIDPPTF